MKVFALRLLSSLPYVMRDSNITQTILEARLTACVSSRSIQLLITRGIPISIC
ncbi:hypothetical protein RchiOBHm_Chr5g0078501 [Rosa chinensis]|uniref:Uncharacterized protein n=1 Tax=Rosa chinensis TaxID=74649 RepID=A0A2P6QM94_ROSCH|nr:hypothetical protein RchiOBHm_Chr5g0078501 [Rosa chinensis]